MKPCAAGNRRAGAIGHGIVFSLVLCGCGMKASEDAKSDRKPWVEQLPPSALSEARGIVLEGHAVGSGIDISVVNRSASDVSLTPRLQLQRKAGLQWMDVEKAQAELRYSCMAARDGCISLVPGAALYPPSWGGTLGLSQCECEGCPRAPTGEYRFVARSCDGSNYVASPPFVLPKTE